MASNEASKALLAIMGFNIPYLSVTLAKMKAKSSWWRSNKESGLKAAWMVLDLEDPNRFRVDTFEITDWKAPELGYVAYAKFIECQQSWWFEVITSRGTRNFSAESLLEGSKAVHGMILETMSHLQRIESEPEYAVRTVLQGFDWEYIYSDDHRVWASGDAKLKALRQFAKEFLPEGRLQEITAEVKAARA